MKLIVAAIFTVLAVSAAAEAENWQIDWSKVVPIQEIPGFWDGREIKPAGNPKPITRGGRIVGGNIVTPHSIPHQAALLMHLGTTTGLCGGSVISNRAILTAAHCPIGSSSTQVILGAHQITTVETTQVRITFPNSSYRIHEGYSPINFSNDVAILITPSNIILTPQIRIVPLASAESETFAGVATIVSGWGRISDASSVNSPQLRSVDNVVITNDVCAGHYGNLIVASTLCTTTIGGRGACDGDTGGPLTIDFEGGRQQIGIVSFRPNTGCQQGHPVAYARVSSFRSWIDSNAQP